ncbi:mitochondrial carrier [Tilletiaria anomala UBC 951]|uniref:Mitochondrial carrier n=1 Tax=Tilletiaria anomala (strain ATCC 24038 / CBS 436.72 / UBC 951) TaxID=1037660 RepID=A0A066W7S4_TILAU|nr:mitochondrial carrier [Tilletiaria anomala UBC 951]KDN46810.1 mitochondrial carrier [Tilletiaria anomala UBC 951]
MAQEPLTPFGNALAGALGGVFSNAVCYPLDTVKTRIQAGSSSVVGASPAAKAARDPKAVTVRKDVGLFEGVLAIARSKEGPLSLYKGFGASMVNTFSTQFAYFYWYTVVRTLYITRVLRLPKSSKPPGISTAVELLLGALAGTLAQIFTIPVSVIATRQQIGSAPASSSGESADKESLKDSVADEKRASDKANTVAKKVLDDEDSFLSVAKDVYQQDGITGFWRGLKPSLVLTINPAITYGVFERVKNMVLTASGDAKMTPGKSFLIGALSKTLATVVTFPYILSKIRLQARNTPYTGAIDVLTKIAKERGIAGWYQGMQAQITKAVLAQALLFYFRDYFEIWTRKLLQASKKTTVRV